MQGMSIQNALRSVEGHQRAGRFVEAEKVCRQILRQQPRQPNALALLSILARLQGQFGLAADRAAEAARVHPEIAEFHANLGEFSRLAGKREESIAAFEQAIRLKPLEPTFHNSLGTVFGDGRQFESAMKEYQRAIQLKPDYADAWNNLGAALREMGRLEEAAEAIGKAMGLQPQLAGTHLNLAIVRTDQERFGEAIESYFARSRLSLTFGKRIGAWACSIFCWGIWSGVGRNTSGGRRSLPGSSNRFGKVRNWAERQSFFMRSRAWEIPSSLFAMFRC